MFSIYFPQLFKFGNFHCCIFKYTDSFFCLLHFVVEPIHWAFWVLYYVIKFPLGSLLYLLFLCWGFSSLVLTVSIIACWSILSWVLSNLCQIIVTSLSSWFWHLLIVFLFSFSLKSSYFWCDKWFIETWILFFFIMLWDSTSYLNLLFYLAFSNLWQGNGVGMG